MKANTLAAFTGKVAALLSASPGGLGGMRGLVHVRSILSNIGVLVLPNQIAISRAHEAFDERGLVRDTKTSNRIDNLVRELVSTTQKLS